MKWRRCLSRKALRIFRITAAVMMIIMVLIFIFAITHSHVSGTAFTRGLIQVWFRAAPILFVISLILRPKD